MTHLQFPPSLYYMQDPFYPVGMQHHPQTSSYPSNLMQQTSIPFNFGRGFPISYEKNSYAVEEMEEEEDDGRNITHLYPEILTMIFSKLDLRSKGRVAQVISDLCVFSSKFLLKIMILHRCVVVGVMLFMQNHVGKVLKRNSICERDLRHFFHLSLNAAFVAYTFCLSNVHSKMWLYR